jgi:hypothetical protein
MALEVYTPIRNFLRDLSRQDRKMALKIQVKRGLVEEDKLYIPGSRLLNNS